MRPQRLLAEGVGTFLLVFIGAGAAAVDRFTGGAVTDVGIALAFACVILCGVYALGHISGAHFNPAVTAAFWLSGRFPRSELPGYVIAQLAGATLGAGLLRIVLGEAAEAAVTVPHLPPLASLTVEIVLSFFLVLVVMAVATDARVAGPVAGLAVGLAVGADALMGGPLTNASMNPARSFGPALITGRWGGHWIYWLGPLAGAALAAPTYAYLRKATAHDTRDAA